MKRVLRSAIDPLPRALSTKSLVALVAVVVFGTAVTVHRYVESGELPPARGTALLCPCATQVRAAPGACDRAVKSQPLLCADTTSDAPDSVSGASAAESSPSHASSTPSVFQPEGDSTGS
jgi:hypothetical protein